MYSTLHSSYACAYHPSKNIDPPRAGTTMIQAWTHGFTLPELDSCFGALVFCVLRSRRAFLRASNSSLR